ncbi:MAG: S8 family serine peptidase [Burkholderiaceae bacterium]|nr:S8 family serine peptidase [Burkholderiaceae bacterium]
MKIVKNISILGFGLIAVMSGNVQSQVQTVIGTNNRLISNANSKAQAMSQLSSQAFGKVDTATLSKMLDRESNDVIVLFEDAAPKSKPFNNSLKEYLDNKKNIYSVERKNFMADVSKDGVEMIHEYSHLPMMFLHLKTPQALVRILNHARVISVADDSIKYQLTSLDNESGPLIHQPGAPAAGITGAGTTVAVMDDGLNYSRSEFGSCTAPNAPQSCRVVAAVPFVAGESFTNTTTTSDKPGAHGTNVASIIGAVAPSTKIAALDVFDGTGNAPTSRLVNALNWVMSNRTNHNIVAVNMSLGSKGRGCSGSPNPVPSGDETMLQNAINGVRSAQVLPVIAAGNDATTAYIQFPACTSGAISVGAVYDAQYTDITYPNAGCTDLSAQTGSNRVTCFSNASNPLTMFAPGAYYIDGGGFSFAGTSQAAPHVAGAVALLRSSAVAPNESLAQIQARLTRSDWTVTDTRNGTSLTKPRLTVMGAIANQHFYVVQQIFVAYFGRPADVTGMTYWANQLGRGAAPTTLSALSSAYSTNPVVKSMFDSFSTSAESGRLYPGTTSDFVTAVYRNLFNRAPDTSGLNYWVGEINSGRITKAQAAVIILLGAQNTSLGQDITTSTRKVEAANRFTTSIDVTAENANYSGTNDVALARGRSTLAQVTNTTNVTAFQSTIDQNLIYISLGL